jgi:hypothetical protein
MGVGTLVLVLAETPLTVVLAEFGFVVGLNMVLLMFELAGVSLPTLVPQEVPAHPVTLQPEEVLYVLRRADVDPHRGSLSLGKEGVECALDLSAHSTVHFN